MYALDHTGMIHSYMMKDGRINSFRMSVTLKESVQEAVLRIAMREVAPKFPTICARLEAKRLAYRVVPLCETGLLIKEETGELLTAVNYGEIEQYAMQILYHDRQIAGEFFHGLTDGYGAFVFMRELLHCYLYHCKIEQQGEVLKQNRALQQCQTAVLTYQPPPFDQETLEECYHRHAVFHRKRMNIKLGGYYHFPYHYPGTHIKVTTCCMRADQLKKMAEAYHCTLTELLTGILFLAVFQMQRREKKNHRKIAVMVPIDLRSVFHEKTLRNFSLYATPVLRYRENGSFSAILPKISRQMRIQKSRSYLENQLFRNEKLQSNRLFVYLPLKLKRRLIQWGYGLAGGKTCMTLSNFGQASFGQDNEAVAAVDFMLSPRYRTPYNASVITFGNELRLALTNDSCHVSLEKQLREILKKAGIDVSIVKQL